ncbi:MAG: hypothetical protein M1834_004286 [Cirrosporium novae-zelandiae]|nr:MAG: hypothetical protein M1834_004286 [Cirrosporium novae-zelandiae]
MAPDNYPMLRDGITGDWIGTFVGHKGAVWQSRLSSDATLSATASADFTAKVWDTYTGECLHTVQHNHIVRAVAFPNQPSPQILATGGHEKKLRIYDLSRTSASSSPTSPDSKTDGTTFFHHEIGPGVFGGPIKAIVWGTEASNSILITASDDNMVRWWDLRTQAPVAQHPISGTLGTCELNAPSTDARGVLSVASGKTAYFFDGFEPGRLIKAVKLPYEVSTVAYHGEQNKFVTGSSGDTWVRVHDFDTEAELDVHKGHHGPVWSVSFSPDGKIYATGSEDGTIKLWKFCKDSYGLWK